MAGRVKKDACGAKEAEQGEERDEHGLTRWHYGLHGRQVICGTCNCSPCTDACPEQWKPDRLAWKAARANLSIAQWAALHADWIAAHANRPDVAIWLEGQQGQRAGEAERRIPVEAAMAQAMAVVAGEARAEDMAPVYEEVEAP